MTTTNTADPCPPPPPLPAVRSPSPPPSSIDLPPFNLPSPLYLSDPVLWSRLNHHLWTTCGLLHQERTILGAVFQHLPTAAPSRIPRLLTLSVEHLRLLARLFSVALLHARAWGGPRGTTATTTNASSSLSSSLRGSPAQSEDSRSTFAIYEPVFNALDIAPLPDGRSLHLPAAPPTPTTSTPARSAKQKQNCLRRHLDTCPITLKSETIEHAHIIPHSIVSLGNQNISPFWMMLGICLGPALRDTVFRILGPGNEFSTTNSLALDTSLHRLIDKGPLHLAPVGCPSATFDPSSCTSYDVRFTWWGAASELAVCLTTVMREPGDQVRPSPNGLQHVRVGPPRFISHGDRFRLFTNDPARYPLPHPLLLDLQGMLWRMLAAASMTEVSAVRKRRLAAGADGDGDGDDDGARRNSARGTPRGGGKRRKKTELPSPTPPLPQGGNTVTGGGGGGPLDSFDLKWVDFRLGVVAAERGGWGEMWEGSGSDCGESCGSEWSDGGGEECAC